MDIFCAAAVYPFQTEALSLSETLFLKTNGEWAPKVFWSKRAPKLNEGFGISRHYGIVLHVTPTTTKVTIERLLCEDRKAHSKVDRLLLPNYQLIFLFL